MPKLRLRYEQCENADSSCLPIDKPTTINIGRHPNDMWQSDLWGYEPGVGALDRIQFWSHRISSDHCRLQLSDRDARVVDLRSGTGTYVNGEKLTDESKVLGLYDTISLGTPGTIDIAVRHLSTNPRAKRALVIRDTASPLRDEDGSMRELSDAFTSQGYDVIRVDVTDPTEVDEQIQGALRQTEPGTQTVVYFSGKMNGAGIQVGGSAMSAQRLYGLLSLDQGDRTLIVNCAGAHNVFAGRGSRVPGDGKLSDEIIIPDGTTVYALGNDPLRLRGPPQRATMNPVLVRAIKEGNLSPERVIALAGETRAPVKAVFDSSKSVQFGNEKDTEKLDRRQI